MSLCIQRKPSQKFTLTWPTGHTKTVECITVDGYKVLVDGKVRNLPAFIFAPDSPEPCYLQGERHRRSPLDCNFAIDAPRSVKVLRDDAINRSEKV